MVSDENHGFVPSCAFTMAALVSFIIMWTNLHPANTSWPVQNLNTLQISADLARVKSFEQMIAPAGWVLPGAQPPFASENLPRELLKRFVIRNLELADDAFFPDLISSGLDLFLSATEVPAHPPNWMTSVYSLRGVCQSSWRQAELSALCRAVSTIPSKGPDHGISIYGLKPILIQRLAYVASQQSAIERVEFLRLWMEHLRAAHLDITNGPLAFEDVPAEISRIETKLYGRELLPVENNFNLVASDRADAVKDGRADDVKDGPTHQDNSRLPMIFEIAERIYANGVDVGSSREFRKKFTPAQMIWASCSVPTLGDLSSLKVADDRLLWVESCGPQKPDVRAYFREGLAAFASANPATAFVSLHIPSVNLSLKWGANRDQHFSIGQWRPSKMDRLLGLSGDGIVKSAIPAVEIFRPEHRGQSLRLSN